MAEWKIAHEGIFGDWVALIQGDEVVCQGHSISVWDVFRAFDIELEDLGEYDLGDLGWFPEQLKDWEGQVKKL